MLPDRVRSVAFTGSSPRRDRFGTRRGSLGPPMRALAYLDPGSGSMILQMLAGGVAAVAVVGKLWWRRFLRLFGIRKEPEEQHSET